MSLYSVHKGEVWFRWKIGKLVLCRMGHTTAFDDKYWFEMLWDGVTFMKVGWYV